MLATPEYKRDRHHKRKAYSYQAHQCLFGLPHAANNKNNAKHQRDEAIKGENRKNSNTNQSAPHGGYAYPGPQSILAISSKHQGLGGAPVGAPPLLSETPCHGSG